MKLSVEPDVHRVRLLRRRLAQKVKYAVDAILTFLNMVALFFEFGQLLQVNVL